MRVKHEDICREFLVNMLRVSRFFRPAFDHCDKKNRGGETSSPPVTSLRQCSSRSVTETLFEKGTNSNCHSHGSLSGFPESFALSHSHIVHPCGSLVVNVRSGNSDGEWNKSLFSPKIRKERKTDKQQIKRRRPQRDPTAEINHVDYSGSGKY